MRRSDLQVGGYYAVVKNWQRVSATSRAAQRYAITDIERTPFNPNTVVGRRIPTSPLEHHGEPVHLDLRCIVSPWAAWERRQQAREAAALGQALIVNQRRREARKAASKVFAAACISEIVYRDYVAGAAESVHLYDDDILALADLLAESNPT